MSVTMTGLEYKQFVNSPWDENCDLYMDDMSYEVNGEPFDASDCDLELVLGDADRVTILSGLLFRNSDKDFRADIVAFARAWLTARMTRTYIVQIGIEEAEAFTAFVAQHFPGAKLS